MQDDRASRPHKAIICDPSLAQVILSDVSDASNSTKLPLLRKGRAAALRKTYEKIALELKLETSV